MKFTYETHDADSDIDLFKVQPNGILELVGKLTDSAVAERIQVCTKALAPFSTEEIKAADVDITLLHRRMMKAEGEAEQLRAQVEQLRAQVKLLHTPSPVDTARVQQVYRLEDDLRVALKLLAEAFPDPDAEDVDRDICGAAHRLIKKHGG